MFRTMLALALFAILGCVSAARGPAPGRLAATRVLCVQDNSVGFGTITVRTEQGLKFHPWPGERVCKRTPVPTRMSVTSIGGGLAGPLRGYMEFRTVDEPCMVWILQGIRDGEVRFVPCTWQQ